MVQSSLVGWWPLHENSGRANDLSGNDNHGTVNGATQGVAGVGGLTSYSFDGSDDYVNPSNNFFDGNAVTVSAWVRNIEFSSRNVILSCYDGTGNAFLRANTDQTIEWGTYDGSNEFNVTSTQIINKYKWYHIVGSYSPSSGYKLYINGSLEDSNNSTSFYSPSAVQYIGARNSQGSADRHTNGSISEVRVYNRALSPSEVQRLYEMGNSDVATPPNGSDPSAVARYTFDDRSDTTTALDEWGANSGAISGATYSADAIRGLSLEFDGSNDIVRADSAAITEPHSMSVWFKARTHTNFDKIVAMANDSSDDPYSVIEQAGSSGVVRTSIDDGTAENVSADAPLGAWHHAVMTVDSSTLSFFLNGVKAGDVSHNKTLTGLNTFGVGGWFRNGTEESYFDGYIDDARLYSRALSDYEVQQLYQYGTLGTDMRYEVLNK
jgi:hypothetical protein